MGGPALDHGFIDPGNPSAGPGLRLQTIDGRLLPGGILVKEHVVGRSPCPDPMDPVVIMPTGDWPPDETPTTAAPETDSPWLDLPQEIQVGQPFTPKFNCRISDRSRHTEEAEVIFRIEGHIGSTKPDVQTELDGQARRYNLPIDVMPLKIELNVR